MKTQTADVIVIGAGLAGLLAAWRIGWAGRHVCVLESSERIGGRILTGHFANGQRIEWGPMGIDAQQKRTLQLIDELGLQVEIDERYAALSTALHAQRDGALSWWHRRAWRRLWQTIEAEAMRLPPQPSPQHPLAVQHDTQHFAQWLSGYGVSKTVADWVERYTLLLFGAVPAELSLLAVLLRIRQAGSVQALEHRSLGLTPLLLPAGMQALCERLTARLGTHLCVNHQVLGLHQDQNGVEVYGRDFRYRAAQVVLAVPALQLSRLDFSPALPGWREHLLRHVMPTERVDCRLRYRKAFWREGRYANTLPLLSPNAWIFEPDGDAAPVLAVTLLGERARRFAREPRQQRERFLLTTLAGLLGQQVNYVEEFLSYCWADDPNLRAAAAFWLPGGWGVQAVALLRSWGRIHFAGADVTPRWAGTLEAAVESGERAAERVLAQF